MIDNIEFLNKNSINALLKTLEEPTKNVFFILIHNNKKILSTLLSRCINFKVSITYQQSIEISENILNEKISNLIHKDFLNYYITPGNLYNLIKLAQINNYDLTKINLDDFLSDSIQNNLYKKNNIFRYLLFDLMELYFRKINLSLNPNIHDKYSYFIKKISDTYKFNLDEDSLFDEFKEEVLDG